MFMMAAVLLEKDDSSLFPEACLPGRCLQGQGTGRNWNGPSSLSGRQRERGEETKPG